MINCLICIKKQLSVTVRDLNDCAPEFDATSYSGSVLENTPIGTPVLEVYAEDADVSPEFRDFT